MCWCLSTQHRVTSANAVVTLLQASSISTLVGTNSKNAAIFFRASASQTRSTTTKRVRSFRAVRWLASSRGPTRSVASGKPRRVSTRTPLRRAGPDRAVNRRRERPG